jgi:hypothetical protein
MAWTNPWVSRHTSSMTCDVLPALDLLQQAEKSDPCVPQCCRFYRQQSLHKGRYCLHLRVTPCGGDVLLGHCAEDGQPVGCAGKPDGTAQLGRRHGLRFALPENWWRGRCQILPMQARTRKGGISRCSQCDLARISYWCEGMRSYWYFYTRSKGGVALIEMYPELMYLDGAPNSAELLLISTATL